MLLLENSHKISLPHGRCNDNINLFPRKYTLPSFGHVINKGKCMLNTFIVLYPLSSGGLFQNLLFLLVKLGR